MYRLTAATYSLFTLFCCFPLVALAQLKADFTADRTGGCAPLVVAFTNTTTGASPAATYEWDFGNGNTGHLKDAGAIFREEQAYTVTLTVRDGNQTAKKTLTITVYKKPAVDFSASLTRGCAPLGVTFTANAQAGDGTVNSYFWDFGDGYTQETTTPSVVHSFTQAGELGVSLTVTNSHGCLSTVVQEKTVTVLPELKASFSAAQSVLCSITDAARFINQSTGPGTLSYQWNFGDGKTSTEEAPSHVFATKGTYPISLSVTSSEGCMAVTTLPTPINAANFQTDFEVALPVCRGETREFKNKSQSLPTRSTWAFGDGGTQITTALNSTWHNYYWSAGPRTVTLINEYGPCRDTATKTLQVHEPPALKGFVADITSPCGAPVQVNFRDTTPTAVKWQWYSGWPANFISDKQAPSYTFSVNNHYYVSLRVTDANGCTAFADKRLPIVAPRVQITSPQTFPSGEIRSCGPMPITFEAVTTETLISYHWDFGDGNTSTEKKPVYAYLTRGDYRVRLTFTTDKGCTGVAEFPGNVVVRHTAKADFVASATEVCGQTPVTFTNTSEPSVYYHWDLGEGFFQASVEQEHSITHQFWKEGLHTIKLVATDWVCSDTMVKQAYIKVSPPFPKIASYTNTCEGARGKVTFTQTSKGAETWHWDFGDGHTHTPTTDEAQVEHTYDKTGWYKVVLTTTNGGCTVRDSVSVTVLLKQKPVLSADRTEVCTRGEFLKISISGLEKNPADHYYWGYGYSPYHSDWKYALSEGTYADLVSPVLTQTKWNFWAGNDGLRVVTQSSHFNCYDTSNLIPLTVKGPAAGFRVLESDPCSPTYTVHFEDTSEARGGWPITSWKWYFGDGRSETRSQGGTLSHEYQGSWEAMVNLEVTDATGCSSIAQKHVYPRASNLKAAIAPSATAVLPGTSVSFTNNTTTWDYGNTTYKWLFPDGTDATTVHTSKTFTTPGTYAVRLVAANTATGCADTATATIVVQYINAAFTMRTSYISTGTCPPVLVRFTNTSSNLTGIRWDFGDGSTSGALNPSHVYTKPGRYRITMRGYSDNGTEHTTVDSVEIGQPSATLAADVLHGCTAQTVTLSAKADNGAAYFWDFGDGTVRTSTDTFARHHYGRGGVYNPQLVVRDTSGCTASVPLDDKIIIDSLAIALGTLPATICSPKAVFFAPTVVHAAAGQGGGDLSYHWDFGTGVAADTSNLRNPSFTYSGPGAYTVRLQVASPYGCAKEASATLAAFQGLGGRIGGPAAICAGEAALFTGSTQLAGQPQWEWIFHDGTKAGGQNAPQRTYPTAGTYPVQLVVNNNGCADTVTHSLAVHALPTVSLPAPQAMVCEGSALSLTASGGLSYSWSPAEGLNTTSGATVEASPRTSTTYTVVATDAHGCSNSHSMTLTVAHPISVQLPAAASLCSGGTLALNASGATSYQWIEGGATLSGTTLPNPVARPTATTDYTVVGADAHGCFTDTATIRVTVHAAPTVNAGPDAEVLTGTPWPLQAVASADVVRYAWTPDRYLSCSACPSPEARPLEPVEYTVTVTNAQGCTASDAVAIQLLCSENRVFIPNSFTPNRDGRNDRFGIIGQGVRTVTYFRIYNRWGELVFEARDFQPGDARGTWDGAYKGLPVPAGAYVYFAEMSCEAETFTRKGTVTVVR